MARCEEMGVTEWISSPEKTVAPGVRQVLIKMNTYLKRRHLIKLEKRAYS